MAKFKVGDVVELKSGGPAMTIHELYSSDTFCECIWFVDDQRQNGHFNVDTVKPVDDDGDDDF